MAGKRHRPSSIDKLPEPVRLKIGKLIAANVTLDEILDALEALLQSHEVEFTPPSRSALGRYAQNLRAVQEKIARSKAMADAFASQLGDKPDDQVFRANIEILQTSIMELLTAVEEDAETGETRAVTFDPKQVQALAKAMQSIASAQKTDADRVLKLRIEVAREAATAVDKVGKQKGLSAETVDDIKFAVLGIARS